MPCYHPLKALRSSSGVTVLDASASIFNLMLPCGRCIGCRLERSRQWALRCVHEIKLHESNCFITLTYDDNHLPSDLSLNHKHFQLFLKRLRKSIPTPVRYYMCGEYGSQLKRPHYHAILFGYKPSDLVLHSRTSSGNIIYGSDSLASIWGKGFVSVGEANFQTAAYCARYIMDKHIGKDSLRHYSDVVDFDTGEIHTREPEYNRMSLKPGIGAGYFDKYGVSDIYNHDRVVFDGIEQKPPRYYDKLFARTHDAKFLQIKKKRMLDNSSRLYDNTPTRLADRETVKLAQIRNLSRSLI